MYKSILVTGLKVYNHLPASLKSLEGNLFKTRLKAFLINEEYYGLSDFLNKSF